MGTRNEVFTGGLPRRPGLPDDHLDRGEPRPGDLLLRGQGQRSLPDGAHMSRRQIVPATFRHGRPVMSGHPAPVARRGPGSRPRARTRLLRRGGRPGRGRTRRPTACYLKGWDEHQHHSLVLASAPDLRARLARLQGRSRRATSTTSPTGSEQPASPPPGMLPATVRRIRRRRPVPRAERAHRRPRTRPGAGRQRHAEAQPARSAPTACVGMAPPRIDHIFLMCEDVDVCHRLLPRRARLPADRADPRR